MFSKPCLHPWVFLWIAQVERALVEWGAELADEGRISREGLTEAGQSVREPRLLSRV